MFKKTKSTSSKLPWRNPVHTLITLFIYFFHYSILTTVFLVFFLQVGTMTYFFTLGTQFDIWYTLSSQYIIIEEWTGEQMGKNLILN